MHDCSLRCRSGWISNFYQSEISRYPCWYLAVHSFSPVCECPLCTLRCLFGRPLMHHRNATLKKLHHRTYSCDLFSEVLESDSSSVLMWVVETAAACCGGSARGLWKEVTRVRFDGANFYGTFWWCIRDRPIYRGCFFLCLNQTTDSQNKWQFSEATTQLWDPQHDYGQHHPWIGGHWDTERISLRNVEMPLSPKTHSKLAEHLKLHVNALKTSESLRKHHSQSCGFVFFFLVSEWRWPTHWTIGNLNFWDCPARCTCKRCIIWDCVILFHPLGPFPVLTPNIPFTSNYEPLGWLRHSRRRPLS